MKIYKSFKQLNGKTLKHYDRVILKPGLKLIVLAVDGPFLDHPADNSRVFNMLGIETRLEQCKFASKAYGYETNRGLFPEAMPDDYEALTRLVLVLFAAYAGDEYVEVKIGKKYVRINLKNLEYTVPVSIKLNEDYTGEFRKTGFKVGCQKISYDIISELYNKAKELSYIK
jgi:hypothetical protein